MQIKEVLHNFPLRISITNHCNLRCFFCSNEGMDFGNRNNHEIDLNSFKYLVGSLGAAGLQTLSLTGGEPAIYSKIKQLLSFVISQNLPRTFFHTNGVSLSRKMIDDYLIYFSKVAVSIHTIDFNIWTKLTNSTRRQFDILLENLEYLGELSKNKKIKVEIKIVPIKGINDSIENIKQFLDFCSENNFRFKFLNFEPIIEKHIRYSLDFLTLLKSVLDIGAKKLENPKQFRGQTSYLPMHLYEYKNTKGVLIEIGCGHPDVCASCYKSNEIFITPQLRIKPCHISPQEFELKDIINRRDDNALFGAILKSREFLKEKPGINKIIWSDNVL